MISLRLSHSQKNTLGSAAKRYAQNIHLAEAYLAERNISLDAAKQAGLGVVSDPITGHEHVQGRLSIPYITSTGVVDIRFRTLTGEEPKYMGLAGAKTHMYNVRALLEAVDDVAICEGEIDAITLHYMVGIPAVAIPGAQSWKKHYRRMLQDFERVYVFGDGDKAGHDFSRTIAREISTALVVNMPDGEDVNSMYTKNGSGFFFEKVKYE